MDRSILTCVKKTAFFLELEQNILDFFIYETRFIAAKHLEKLAANNINFQSAINGNNLLLNVPISLYDTNQKFYLKTTLLFQLSETYPAMQPKVMIDIRTFPISSKAIMNDGVIKTDLFYSWIPTESDLFTLYNEIISHLFNLISFNPNLYAPYMHQNSTSISQIDQNSTVGNLHTVFANQTQQCYSNSGFQIKNELNVQQQAKMPSNNDLNQFSHFNNTNINEQQYNQQFPQDYQQQNRQYQAPQAYQSQSYVETPVISVPISQQQILVMPDPVQYYQAPTQFSQQNANSTVPEVQTFSNLPPVQPIPEIILSQSQTFPNQQIPDVVVSKPPAQSIPQVQIIQEPMVVFPFTEQENATNQNKPTDELEKLRSLITQEFEYMNQMNEDQVSQPPVQIIKSTQPDLNSSHNNTTQEQTQIVTQKKQTPRKPKLKLVVKSKDSEQPAQATVQNRIPQTTPQVKPQEQHATNIIQTKTPAQLPQKEQVAPKTQQAKEIAQKAPQAKAQEHVAQKTSLQLQKGIISKKSPQAKTQNPQSTKATNDEQQLNNKADQVPKTDITTKAPQIQPTPIQPVYVAKKGNPPLVNPISKATPESIEQKHEKIKETVISKNHYATRNAIDERDSSLSELLPNILLNTTEIDQMKKNVNNEIKILNDQLRNHQISSHLYANRIFVLNKDFCTKFVLPTLLE